MILRDDGGRRRSEMGFVARKIERHELDKLLDLYGHLHDEEVPARDRLDKAWEIITGHGRFFTCFAVEADGRFVSSCCVAIIPNLTRGARPFAVIENVITRPESRRKGFGRMVVGKAIEHARGENCYKVMLLSGVAREDAHRFYVKLGFSPDSKKGFVLNA